MELFELAKLLSFIKDPMVFWLVVGTFVGWNLPQPVYAKVLQDKVVALVVSVYNKVKSLLAKKQ